MAETRVISVRGRIPDELRADPAFTYVGRQCAGWPKSPWGNPFKSGTRGMSGFGVVEVFKAVPESDLTRGVVIPVGHFAKITAKQAVEYFETWLKMQPDYLHEVRRLHGKTLGCWCGEWRPGEPEIVCHAVVLAKLADAAVLEPLTC